MKRKFWKNKKERKLTFFGNNGFGHAFSLSKISVDTSA